MKILHGIITNKIMIYGAALAVTLAFAAVMHAYNMTSYPYYESDEGTYISQAWSLINTGELTPYTYWYDHPPLGWIFLALWVKIFAGGDFFRFGTSVDTFRVCMLCVHLISTATIFYIVHRVTKNLLAAIFAGFLFSISPLEIYFQRRVLLDNVMIMWLLFSVAVLHTSRMKLRHIIFSAFFFAFAVLSKITAIMFGPVLLVYIMTRKNGIPLVFRTVFWLATSIMTTSFYILYAFLRNEFFPAANGEHVSFIESFIFQMSRKGLDVPFWHHSSDFYNVLNSWINKDEYAVIGIAAIMVMSLIGSLWFKNVRFFVVAFFFYFLFLIRGGVVINFYILPLLPFFAMAGAIMAYNVATLFSRRDGIRAMVIAVPFCVIALYYALYGPRVHFLRDETSAQKNAITWIKQNLPNESAVIIDAYALVDIRDPHNVNNKTFPNADWFYKINRDPAIRSKKYNDSWQSFDYIALTHEMLSQIELDSQPLVKDAYRNSLPMAKWLGDKQTFVDEQSFRTTNGDWAMIFKVNDTYHAQLLDSWESYRSRYVLFDGENYGRVTDPSNGITTSEGQSYAMLRAAWMNDHQTFLATWLWARNHLQHRVSDKLFSWQWKGDALVDAANATDADEDIALALLFGYKLWDDESYLVSAREIIDDLWENCVVKVNGRYYFLPMHEETADKWSGYLFNPSYLSPAHYRIFAIVDPKHEWEELADDSYEILSYIGELEGNETYLPSDWYYLDKKYGGLYTANTYFDRDVDHFSFDAFRTLWRVALDEQWFGTQAARDYLHETAKFTSAYQAQHDNMPMILNIDGSPVDDRNALAMDVGYAISMLYGDDDARAQDFFGQYVQGHYDPVNKWWKDGTSYYDENWAWLGTGVFHRDLPNMWNLNVFREDNDLNL